MDFPRLTDENPIEFALSQQVQWSTLKSGSDAVANWCILIIFQISHIIFYNQSVRDFIRL